MLSSFTTEDGIFLGNIFISEDLKQVSCSTANFLDFEEIGVQKDYANKSYTALMFRDNCRKLVGTARAKFRDDISNKSFEKWLEKHGITLVEVNK